MGVEGAPSTMHELHVKCTGCHIERTTEQAGELSWFSWKASPEACDSCHGEGFGKGRIGDCQEVMKESFEELTVLLKEVAAGIAKAEQEDPDLPGLQEIRELYERALANARFVRVDGSWGVHNMEYTDAVLESATADVEECLKRLQGPEE